jgi:tRNA-dihydrouridine synthase B
MNISDNFQLKSFCIGDITIDPPIIFAPLAEITDVHLRPLIKKIGGLGLVESEMISSEGVTRLNPRSLRTLMVDPDEHPIALQIYGANPERMAAAAKLAVEAGADIIDINFGCPSKNIIKGKVGVALMKNPTLSKEIIKAVREAVNVPVMAKFRLGWDNKTLNYIDFGLSAAEAGADALTLHARTGKAGFSGEVDHEAWKMLAESSPVPVIANGNINSTSRAREAFVEYKASGIMIGRAALKNPFIFKTIWNELTGDSFEPSRDDYSVFFKNYYQAISRNDNHLFLLHKLRIMSSWLSCSLHSGSAFRKKINSFEDETLLMNEFLAFIDHENVSEAVYQI